MTKTISTILAAVMLGGSFAAHGAVMPFPGADLLTVKKVGEPVTGASVELYRVNPYSSGDTLLGTYETNEKGSVSVGHLTTGLYRWSCDNGEVTFRITGAGFVRTVLEVPADVPEDGHEQMTYMSADGFQIRYNALTVESRDIDEHTAEFVYLGEPTGANKVTVRWIAEKQPEEALYETVEAWGGQEKIQRSEGLFPGTDDKWGYWRTLEEDKLVKSAIAGEYNGGVLMFEIESLLTGDEAADMTVSDTLAELIDSITYFDFGPQTMYSYIPGVYESADETGAKLQVILNEDHTGTLCFEDPVEFLWGSTTLTAPGVSYSYTVEGENLYVEMDGDWVEFAKKTAE